MSMCNGHFGMPSVISFLQNCRENHQINLSRSTQLLYRRHVWILPLFMGVF